MLTGIFLAVLMQEAPAAAPDPPSAPGEFSSLAPERDAGTRYTARKIGFAFGIGVSAALIVAGLAMIAGNLATDTEDRRLMYAGIGLAPAGVVGLTTFSVLYVRNQRGKPTAEVAVRPGLLSIRS